MLAKKETHSYRGAAIKALQNRSGRGDHNSQKGPLTQHLRILHVLDRRVGASKASECYEDLTPQENYQKASEQKRNQVQLKIESSAKGRPSKKQRRDLEAFFFQE